MWLAALAALAGLGGCTAGPQDVASSFVRAIEQHDLGGAGAYCTRNVRESLTNVPFARAAFDYQVKTLTGAVVEVQAVGSGVVVYVDVALSLSWPPASIHAAAMRQQPPYPANLALRMHLSKAGRRWYIDAIDVSMDAYVEFVTERQPDGHALRFAGSGVRWPRVYALDEPIGRFARRVDGYMCSWAR